MRLNARVKWHLENLTIFGMLSLLMLLLIEFNPSTRSIDEPTEPAYDDFEPALFIPAEVSQEGCGADDSADAKGDDAKTYSKGQYKAVWQFRRGTSRGEGFQQQTSGSGGSVGCPAGSYHRRGNVVIRPRAQA